MAETKSKFGLKVRNLSGFKYPWQRALWVIQEARCFYCGLEFSHPLLATLEHLRPRSQGGDISPWNVVYACASCNWKRDSRPLTLAEQTKAAQIMTKLWKKAKLEAPPDFDFTFGEAWGVQAWRLRIGEP